MSIVFKTSFLLTIIGALNWGLVGFFGFNLVSFLFGEMTLLTRLVYILVGISAVIILVEVGKKKKA